MSQIDKDIEHGGENIYNTIFSLCNCIINTLIINE